jgi:ATP-dependent DNA ligase
MMPRVDLPVMPPVAPMLARVASAMPEGDFLYEPKWDGFRTIVFRDGAEVELGSRNEKPMTRYFPEVLDAVRAGLPPRCVVDGEIIVPIGGHLEFESLQQRIHPAVSRVRLLAEQTPAVFVAFDLLALGDVDVSGLPFRERRAALERLLEVRPPVAPGVTLTPATSSVEVARNWFRAFEGAGLDGIVAKPLDGTYQPDVRAMTKIKHERTADVVVAGIREHKASTPERPLVGSLLLGLYDDAGRLAHIGVCASFPMARRAELFTELLPLHVPPREMAGHPWGEWSAPAADAGRQPGNTSRWNAGKDLSFVPLRPERVLEVAYDQMQGDRLRHTGQWRRWRPDRDPRSCTYSQLERPVRFELPQVFADPESVGAP